MASLLLPRYRKQNQQNRQNHTQHAVCEPYEVKTFSEKLEKLENTISSTKNSEVDGILAVTDELLDILYKLPLKSEELKNFEMKLLDDNI